MFKLSQKLLLIYTSIAHIGVYLMLIAPFLLLFVLRTTQLNKKTRSDETHANDYITGGLIVLKT